MKPGNMVSTEHESFLEREANHLAWARGNEFPFQIPHERQRVQRIPVYPLGGGQERPVMLGHQELSPGTFRITSRTFRPQMLAGSRDVEEIHVHILDLQ